MEGCLMRVSARRTNRSHARRRVAALGPLACLVALIATAPAAASVTLGQLAPTAPSPGCVASNVDYLQPSVTGGNFYIARQAGMITSWSTNSSGAGAAYVFKIFRRTSDPDVFQVIGHAPARTLTSGLNTVGVSLAVKSGDMIGINESGPPNSCTFLMQGDTVLNRAGNLADGAMGAFGPQNDVRLNLSAVLVPDNGFTLGGVTHDRRRGTATVTATTSNPGAVTVSGKGLKKHALKTIAVAGPVSFQMASVGKAKRRLGRKGKVTVPLTVTFFPTGGDPSSQSIQLKLKKVTPGARPPV
jgi:hypothetical protein